MHSSRFRKSGTRLASIHSAITGPLFLVVASLAPGTASFAASAPATATLHITVTVLPSIETRQTNSAQPSFAPAEGVVYNLQEPQNSLGEVVAQERSVPDEQREARERFDREKGQQPALRQELTFASQ